MIDIERRENLVCRFILRPNCSLSWRGMQVFLAFMALILGAIGAWFTLLGFWLVLPFAGLELLLLACAFYLVARRGQVREVISIDQDSVHVEKGRRYPEKQCTLARGWARVVLERCPKQWYPSRLLIRSHGRAVEVGTFLNEEERRRLAEELAQNL